MKKLTYVLPLAAIAFASCANDETITQSTADAIQFRTLVQGSTRGEVVTVSNLDEFHVETVDGTGIKSGETINETVVSNDGGNSWVMKSGKAYFWADEGTAKFTAYSPVDLDFSAPVIEQQVKNQKDIVIAYKEASKETAGSGVALNFKHALSQIVVLAANKNVAQRRIEVVGVKLENVKNSASLQKPVNETNENYVVTWGAASGNASYIAKRVSNEVVELTETPQDIMFGQGSMFVVPQQLDGTEELNGAYLSVLLRITDISGDAEKTIFPKPKSGETTSDLFAFAAVPVNNKLEAGKCYTYTLNFYYGDGGAGLVDPDQTNPDLNDGDDDPSNDKKDEDIDTKPGQGDKDKDKDDSTDEDKKDDGDPIDETADTPIFFTVTVDNWQETPVSTTMQ